VIWSLVLPGLLLLGLVIFVHELGHFLVAKWRGVRVLKFSLGFGPPLIKWTKGETEYRLSIIPLGGYVQMAGDSPDEDGTMPGGKDEFLSHPWFGRLLIAAAGPAANLITAYVVMVTVGLIGVSYPDYSNQLGAIPDTSRAYQAGLREGDRIVAVGGQPTKSWIAIFVKASEHPKNEAMSASITSSNRIATTMATMHSTMSTRDSRHPAQPWTLPTIGCGAMTPSP